MRHAETAIRPGRCARLLGCLAVGGAWAAWAAAAMPEQPDFLHLAPIAVQRSAPFIEVPLNVATYGRSLSPGLADLRVVDAQGERVPFALLAPTPGQAVESRVRRPARIYPLPARAAGLEAGSAAVELSLENGRLSVRQGAAQAPPSARSPGWLVDLGEPVPGAAAPAFIEFAWSGPAEFSAGYRLETSDDLRQWRTAGGGQLMSLTSSTGPLTQPLVALQAPVARYVKLEWVAGEEPPSLSGAQAVSLQAGVAGAEVLAEVTVAAAADVPAAGARPRAVLFDLGAALPVAEVALIWSAGTHVAPARVQGRSRPDQPWAELSSTVFYRLERAGSVSLSPALPLQAVVRYLRVVPDERAAALSPAGLQLKIRAGLGRLVFAAQGVPPFALLAGAPGASGGALPIQTLVPLIQQERARFGSGELGEWQASGPAMARAEAEQRRAAWRPVLLWGALLLAVAGLAAMVWRLARSQPKR